MKQPPLNLTLRPLNIGVNDFDLYVNKFLERENLPKDKEIVASFLDENLEIIAVNFGMEVGAIKVYNSMIKIYTKNYLKG